MKLNLCAKTVLRVYRYLDRIADAIDRLVERRALNSFYMSGIGCKDNNISNVAQYIIDLSQRKVKLINIKILTEMALDNCPILYSQILIEKYMDNDKACEIAKRHNLSERTYFRRLNEALRNFSITLEKLGFSESKLLDYISSEKWMIEVYNRLITVKNEDNFNVSNCDLGKIAVC